MCVVEEALRSCEGNEKMTKEIRDDLDAVFAQGGHEIYTGYVDDPRNTDVAWVETTVCHFPISSRLAEKLPLMAGDDAAKVQWIDVVPDMQLYASHKDWVDVVRHRSRLR